MGVNDPNTLNTSLKSSNSYIVPLFPLIDNTEKYVDLGLSSGTLWGTCNIGASKPSEEGLYFAYGETEGYTKEQADLLSWRTYKWWDNSENILTKYCTNSEYGIVDNKTTLDPEDDAAYIHIGENWRLPTGNQTNELINAISEINTVTNKRDFRCFEYIIEDVKGFLIYPRNNNTKLLFIPTSNDWKLIDPNMKVETYVFSNRDVNNLFRLV